jgi:hypothetical protein
MKLTLKPAERQSRAVTKRMGTPVEGPIVMLRRFGTTGAESSNAKSNRLSNTPSTMIISYEANAAPMHRRCPPPKGMY